VTRGRIAYEAAYFLVFWLIASGVAALFGDSRRFSVA
jgi:hypothetical protein